MKNGAQQAATRRASELSSPEETIFVELARTTDLLSRVPAQVIKSEDLSSTQYNVLRILRGAQGSLTCSEIGERMITRDPDITRLLDRLEKRGLVARHRDTKDRRVVLTRIAAEGLKLLKKLDQPLQAAHHRQLGHLGLKRLNQLAELLAEARKQAG